MNDLALSRRFVKSSFARLCEKSAILFVFFVLLFGNFNFYNMPDNFDKYEATIKELSRESGRMAWSSGNSTVFYMLLLVIAATVAARTFFPFANMLVTMFIFIAEGVALFIPIALYHHKAGVYMQNKCLELEATNPGIYEAYEEWRRRIAEKLPDGYSS